MSQPRQSSRLLRRQRRRSLSDVDLHKLEFELGFRNDPPAGYHPPAGVFIRVGGLWIADPVIDLPDPESQRSSE